MSRDSLFEGLKLPVPAPNLRDRVLRAARSAGPQPADLWERAWNSRGLRLAWAAVVFGLMLAHSALSMSGPLHPDSDTVEFRVAAVSVEPELEPLIAMKALDGRFMSEL